MKFDPSALTEFAPARDRIDIWLHPISAGDFATPPTLLDAQERERYQTMGSPLQRDKFATGRALARTVLAHAVGQRPEALAFNSVGNGKLMIDAYPSLAFNLSFANGFAALAITKDTRLGFDMEALEQDFGLETVARRFFSSFEMAKVLSTPSAYRRRPFFEIWTLKEAFIKATGEGFRSYLEHLKFEINQSGCISYQIPTGQGTWSFAQLDLLPGLIGAICIEAPSISYSNIKINLLSEDGKIRSIQPLKRCRTQAFQAAFE